MQRQTKILIGVLTALALVAVPLVAASPGKSGASANAHAERGMAKASEKADGASLASNDTAEDNATESGKGALKRAERANATANGTLDGHAAGHGLHKGWLKIQERMPEKFRAWWGLVLGGLSVREARAGAA